MLKGEVASFVGWLVVSDNALGGDGLMSVVDPFRLAKCNQGADNCDLVKNYTFLL